MSSFDLCERCAAPREAHGLITGLGVCDDYHSLMKRRYYLYGLGMWILVVVFSGLLATIFPFLRTSVLSFSLSLFTDSDYDQSAGSLLDGWPVFLFGLIIVLGLGKRDRIYRYARKEEESYRRGAEHWPLRRRVWSCLRFGVAHIWNLIVSLALVVGLSLMGFYFMLIYLRRYRESGSQAMALESATHAHVAFNRIALSFIALVLAIIVVAGLIHAV